MADIEDIKEQLQRFSAQFGPSAVLPAIVKNTNDDGTIEIEFADGSRIDDVQLKAVTGGVNQFVVMPAIDSNVLVGRISSSDEYVLLAASEIVSVDVKINNTRLFISDKFTIQAGTEDLLQILKDLIQAMINEKHQTNTGPTISLTPASILRYNDIKTRFETLLKSS